MIISASRRTDLPAFYSEWFMNRIKEGYCTVENPFNKKQVSRISLQPESVDVIVFWSKNPKPLMRYLDELDARGYKYYFQYTLTNYSKLWEPNIPDIQESIETFLELSKALGGEKVIWRYDPIIFSNVTDFNYHYRNFTKLADMLKGSADRVMISILDDYRGAGRRIKELQNVGVRLMNNPMESDEFKSFIKNIADYSKDRGIDMYSCAEAMDLKLQGVQHGKCIDAGYIKEVFKIDVDSRKDKNQRPECGCALSRDIGSYDTCPHRCVYCYAVRSEKIAAGNYEKHEKHSSSLKIL